MVLPRVTKIWGFEGTLSASNVVSRTYFLHSNLHNRLRGPGPKRTNLAPAPRPPVFLLCLRWARPRWRIPSSSSAAAEAVEEEDVEEVEAAAAAEDAGRGNRQPGTRETTLRAAVEEEGIHWSIRERAADKSRDGWLE